MKTSARIAALAAAAAFALSACSALSPNATQFDYSASDGAQERVGDVFAHNLRLFTTGAGEEGVVIASLTNEGPNHASVTVTWDQGSSTVQVPARSTVLVGPSEGSELVIGSVETAPGLLAEVTITVAGETSTFPVPVMDATLPEYDAYLEFLSERAADEAA